VADTPGDTLRASESGKEFCALALFPERVTKNVITRMAMASILISAVSLLVSGTVAYLTLFRRGAVKMTQPTVIFRAGCPASKA
jgi:hypothetical protein